MCDIVICVYVFLVCYAESLNPVVLFVTPWTEACQAPLSLGILQARVLEWVAVPGIKPMSPALQASSLPSEPPGKPMNTGVSRSSLLQGIFSTRGSNLGLPHCRQILYQLRHKGSPRILEWGA